MEKIAIITARGGSKGLPNKNVMLTSGKPVISFTIEAALESKVFNKIVVSTDSQEYIDLLSHYPVEFIKRDAHLAQDTTGHFVVIEDFLNKYEDHNFDYFVLLQPTSPLRTGKHIQELCDKFEKNFDKFDFCISVTTNNKTTALTRVIDADESLKNFDLDYSSFRRQDYPTEFHPNGAIWAGKKEPYLKQKHFYGAKCLAYFMDKNSSIDIDDKNDFEYFYYLQTKEKNDIRKIKKNIQAKYANFLTKSPITLIGDNILDEFCSTILSGQNITNLAFSGISTLQYIDFVFNENLINKIGNKILINLGGNDLTKNNYNPENTIANLQTIIDKLHKIDPSTQIYLIEILPVAFRIDRNNQQINELNALIKQNIKNVQFIEIASYFYDKYQKLNLELSDDGLHLNAKGYQKLTDILQTIF